MCENYEVSSSSVGVRPCDRRMGAAGVCASVQSEEVYAATTVRLLGAERIPAVGLPQTVGPAGRLPGLVCGDPSGCVPHYTTFQKAAARLLISRLARRTLHWTIHVGIALRRLHKRVVLAALDGTGFESHHASRYYVQRRVQHQQILAENHVSHVSRRPASFATAPATWCWPLSPDKDRGPIFGISARRWTRPSRSCIWKRWPPMPATTRRLRMNTVGTNAASAR